MKEVPGVLKLSLIKGLGPVTVKRLIDGLGDPEGFGALGAAAVAGAGGIRPDKAGEILRLLDGRFPEAEEIMERVSLKGYRMYLYGAKDYPVLLKEIFDPPTVIYAAGSLRDEDYASVAVVGTRKASAYGRAAACRISELLARRGITVVSGCAMGIDAAAHRGSLNAGGRTVGVLGSGLDKRYPALNAGLMEEISEKGALISEFPPDEEPAPHNFPMRNRIISGLSLAVVVAEAPEKSGALITAARALEQGRSVLAVPGSIFSDKSAGCNRLIKEGAVPVSSEEEIFEEISGQLPRDFFESNIKIRQSALSGPEETVLEALSDGEVHIDTISLKTGMTVEELAGYLTDLELKGMVMRVSGKNYVKV